MPSKRRLILMRHAHRDVSDRRADNGLSEKGRKQALKICGHFAPQLETLDSVRLLSSPKKRCVETLQPLAERISKPLEIDEGLIERQDTEDSQNFETRLDDWIQKQEQTSGLLIACSHGDCLPTLVHKMTELHVDFGKSGWAELHQESDGAPWVIHEFVRSANDLPDD